ncbi:MAG TPA: DNA-3-methyladenine glycosylase I [Candidatus Marinimicrobia bacterium]|nr:DNA-3-methyladenine glycosylase I [Candidatus Neomarinimicrobiota bacterium]
MTQIIRCNWAESHSLLQKYHDTEWGVPLWDDQKLFEFLILDGFQAGLSWLTILKKRPSFQLAFDQFDPEIIARYDEAKKLSLMQNPGIIRNRLKIEAAVTNAQAYLRLSEKISFSKFLWQFTGGETKINCWGKMQDIPGKTSESDAMSKALIERGFKFTGTTICYAFMQAAGMVNDHIFSCFRYSQVQE